MNTFERVRSIVADHLHLEGEEITPETSLEHDLKADSLDLVEITMALEETFCVDFGDDAMELTTVQQIVDYIETKKGDPQGVQR